MSSMTTTSPPLLFEKHLSSEQQSAITRLYEHDNTLLIAGLGFGKAIVGLTAVNQLINDGVLDRVLVLAPLSVARLTWRMEPDKWGHINACVAIATGTPTQRKAAVDSGAQIVVTNFENIGWILDNYGDSFDGLLVDEISRLKSGGSWVKKMRGWVKGLKWRAGMSGTPVAESSIDLYSQLLIIDCGASLGTRKDTFLGRYFYPTDYNQYNWELKPGAAERLCVALKDVVFVAKDQGYKDGLPKLTTTIVRVSVPEEVMRIYDKITKTSCWGAVEAVNEAVKSSKLQQLAAGGLYAGDDRELVFTHNYKLDALTTIVSQQDSPVIIVYNFAFEIAALRALYPAAPLIDKSFGVEQLEKWGSGGTPVLLLHWKSGSHGLNLQGGGHIVIHTSPLWAADGWKQVIGRVHRRGQVAKECKRIVLVSVGTVDEKIVQKLAIKSDNEMTMMTMMRGNV